MISSISRIALNLMVFAVLLSASGALAQEQAADGAQPQRFAAAARAIDATVLKAGNSQITLWGVQAIEGLNASLKVAARTALENSIGAGKVECELKKRTASTIEAQCTNQSDVDLALFMLQQGYALADRAAVYGTVYEQPYLQAEMDAQRRGRGIWSTLEKSGSGAVDDSQFMSVLGLVVFIGGVIGLAVLAIFIMRGFKSVVASQDQNIEMMIRERAIRNKEREIIAMMMDAEIKANKSKIEAYMVVYEEMFRALKNPERTPKYKKAGDIVQAQPALDRAVFERNTDKLDILGDRLASEVIHFYARIKTKPEYINIEPETPLDEAVKILDKCLKNAQKLNEIADRLIGMFAQGGHAAPDYEE